ncbi:hypothetical protein EZV62_025183 [Acer yangbiense]|uniref:Uncharacterized protein n=1 Tax=Acer yangbiense TaxID=1000413 RepID=A0A5C7GX42_9ROSI|nr:hypothetical protein EZV62_025183 [Acer yangbiense]
MGFRKLVLLIMFFTFLHMFESSSPLQKPLHSESLQDIQPSNEDQHSNKNDNYGRSSVIYSSKIARGGLGGASGGKSTGSGESTGNNGGSSSPYVQGGTAVIPVYAGGAASNRHPNTHSGAGNSNHNGIGLLALILTALTSLVHLCSE